jgi:tetratricopeptide (TPR) repeat protein
MVAGFAGVVWQWRVAESARDAESVARGEADQRIVDLQNAVELVDRSKQFRVLRQLDDAVQCLNEAVRLRPEYRGAWEERGHFHGHFGLWDLALTDRRQAMKLGEPSLSIEWWTYAVLLANAGDRENLGDLAARMRQRFRGSTGVPLLEVVRSSCLMNSAGTDYDQLVKLVQLETPEDTEFPLNAYVRGLAHYRAGQFDQAVTWCGKSVELSQGHTNRWPCYGLNYPVQALAYSRLDRTDDAATAMDHANKWADHWTQQLYDSGIPRWVYLQGEFAWPLPAPDWLEFQTLLHEARHQLHENPASIDPRWLAIRARSFAALGRIDDAIREYQSALTLSRDDAQLTIELHRSLAIAAARRAEYPRAAIEFGNASHLLPDDALLLQYHAQAHLYAGNVNAYRRLCRKMLRRFAATQDPEAAARVVHTCAQQDDSLPNMKELLPLSKIGARAWPGGEWLQGATCVRTGQYAEALRYFQQAELRHVPRPRDMCFKAIAYHYLGQAEQSERCLQDARDWMRHADRVRLPVTDVSVPTWGPWYEPTESKALLAEAESLRSTSAPRHFD